MNRMGKFCGAAVVVGAVFAAGMAVGAQQQAGGTRREPQFENSELKVWKSIIMPNQPLSLHRHEHGRAAVVLKGGSLDVVDATGATVDTYKWETGKAYWLDADKPGTQHGDMNRGKEPIEVVIVELKNDQKK
jgi:beta-alanine degradation protein BauB